MFPLLQPSHAFCQEDKGERCTSPGSNLHQNSAPLAIVWKCSGKHPLLEFENTSWKDRTRFRKQNTSLYKDPGAHRKHCLPPLQKTCNVFQPTPTCLFSFFTFLLFFFVTLYGEATDHSQWARSGQDRILKVRLGCAKTARTCEGFVPPLPQPALLSLTSNPSHLVNTPCWRREGPNLILCTYMSSETQLHHTNQALSSQGRWHR